LSQKLVTVDPQNPKWKIEPVYADSALGAVLMDQGQYQRASATFRRALDVSEALASSEPKNEAYQYRLLEALAWLADANRNEGKIEEALTQRERQLRLLGELMGQRPDDKELTRKAMTAHRAMSKLLLARGDLRSALEQARKAGRFADALIQTEPSNTEWMEYAAGSKLDLGALLRISRDLPGAASAVRSGCDIGSRLMIKDSSVRTWKEDLRLQCLRERAKVALAQGSTGEGLAVAQDAVRLAQQSRGATPTDAALLRASAFNLLGHALASSGKLAEAGSAWRSAENVWPRNRQLTPDELALKSDIARHLHNDAESKRIAATLNALGYRNPEYLHEAKQGAET
jgi:tetratricopeptide (TPR) repeat protein